MAQDLSQGLVAYWSMNSTLDDGVADSDGVLMGGSGVPTFAPGKIGQALQLNGVNEFVEINPTNESRFDGIDDEGTQTGLSVTAWFRVNAFDKDWQALIAKGEENRWRIHRRGAESVLTGNGGNADVAQGPTAVNDGEWHQVTLVSTPDVGVKLFVDGAVEGESGAPILQNNDMPLMIGENPDARNRTWNGWIDEVAFWGRALSDDEVAQLWNGGAGIDLGEDLGLNLDSDGDGMPDIYEINHGLDPNVDDSEGDLDGDGLTNKYEFDNGLLPNDDDTDNDGLKDGVETNTGIWVSPEDTGTDPKNRDSDGDTLRDGVENPDLPFLNVTQPGTDPNKEDTDGDGVRDAVELDRGSDPTDSASVPGIDLGERLAGYWPLDDDLEDATGGGSDGELMGGADDLPDFEDGILGGGALLLDGVSEHVVINPENEPLFDGFDDDTMEQTGFTVSTWFRVNAFEKDWQALVAKGELNTWRIHRRAAESVMTANGGNADVSQGTTAVNDGEWHHLALVSTPEVGVQLFVDGGLEGSSAAPVLEDNNQPMMIGENPGALGRTWNGLIDDVAFWQRPLGEDEVTAIYEGGLAGMSIGDFVFGPAASMPVVDFVLGPDTVTLDFITVNTAGIHGLERSTDVRAWSLVEDASIEVLEGNVIRAMAAREPDEEVYYRGVLLGVPPIFSDDLESGAAGWTATIVRGDTAWELGTPAVAGLMAAHSGANAWGTNLAGPYTNLAVASLRTPVIDLTGVARPRLSFWYYVDATEGAEGVQLKYLDESGEVELFVSESVFWGTTPGWTEYSQSVPAAAREQRVIIEFLFLSDEGEPNGTGFYLDDLVVED